MPCNADSTGVACWRLAASGGMFDAIDHVVRDIADGKFVIVLDDENRENEGDLIIAASKVTTEQMAWFIRHTRCVAVLAVRPR